MALPYTPAEAYVGLVSTPPRDPDLHRKSAPLWRKKAPVNDRGKDSHLTMAASAVSAGPLARRALQD
ncbi:MAG: hypothetical protein AAF597_04745 [Bacteroidota bacterium]